MFQFVFLPVPNKKKKKKEQQTELWIICNKFVCLLVLIWFYTWPNSHDQIKTGAQGTVLADVHKPEPALHLTGRSSHESEDPRRRGQCGLETPVEIVYGRNSAGKGKEKQGIIILMTAFIQQPH